MAATPVRDKRAAIVTGGATGVGAATAVMLAQRGYDIAIVFSKSCKEAEETADACERAGARAIAINCNVAEDRDCKAAVAEVGDVCAFALDGGPITDALDSTVIDLASDAPRILREGAIDRETIARILGLPTIEVLRSVRP